MNVVSLVLLSGALELAAAGLPVFPCAANKRPCIPKNEGGDGFKDATTDPIKVRELFKHSSARLIGVPTGARSGFDILDFDYRNGAADWEKQHLNQLPETRIHQSKSGGRHLVLKHHPGLRNSASKIGRGIDVRAEGGYACWPPSPGYSVIHDTDPADWPEWLLKLARKPEPVPARPATAPPGPISSRRLQAFIEKQLGHVRGAPDGMKHDTLLRSGRAIGGVMEQAGLSDDGAIGLLIAALPATVLNWNSARETAAWAVAEGRKAPLQLEDRPNSRSRTRGCSTPADEDAGYRHSVEAAAGAEGAGQEAGQLVQPTGTDAHDRPIIEVTAGHLHELATAAEDAVLRAEANIYQRAWVLVRPMRSEVPATRDRTTITAGLGKISRAAMLDTLSQAATWTKYDGRRKEQVIIDPPKLVVEVLLSREGLWRLPRIRGVITSPSMRWDGSLLTEPGFDQATGLYHMTDPNIRLLPAVYNPTRQDAEHALDELQELLVEFPFVAGTASESVALSAILSVVARAALQAVPMHLFRAATPGTGKSYLADVVSAITNGRPCPAFAWKSDQVEAEKGLTSLLLAGYPLISIDNVNGQLAGDLLSQAIERPIVQVRKLGVSEVFDILNASTILATGNNTIIVGDLTRRVVVADMDRQEEQPELHEFKGDPVATVLADRSRYISAALIILRAYLTTKDKPQKPKPLNSFGDWSDLVRAALIWLDCPDPCNTMQSTRDSDPVLAQLGEMLTVWHAAFGTMPTTAAEVVKVLDAQRFDPETGYATSDLLHADLREVLQRYFGERGTINTRRLGNWLASNKGRIIGRLRFAMASTKGENSVAKWQIEAIDKK